MNILSERSHCSVFIFAHGVIEIGSVAVKPQIVVGFPFRINDIISLAI